MRAAAHAREHSGDLYCCDHFVEPDYLLGNITETPMQQLITSSTQTRFGQDKRDMLTDYCLDCDVRFACHGGCPKDRFAKSPYGESGQHYLCPSYKAFFHHVDRPMRAMVALLATGRAPADLIGAYAAQDAKRGRNEPCPCGSGRKWKHCHAGTQS
jgi:serine-type anaerobic sulfatase-maturating enzyme